MTDPKSEHPAEQMLRDFCTGLLDDDVSSVIESHLETCEACCDVLTRFGEIDTDRFITGLRSTMRARLSSEPEPPAPSATKVKVGATRAQTFAIGLPRRLPACFQFGQTTESRVALSLRSRH